MSSNPLSWLVRSLTFRMTLWYALTFAASAAVLFVLMYVLLAASLRGKDAEIIKARVKEYAAIYESGGSRALQAWLSSDRESREAFFVRLITARGTMTALTVPPDWMNSSPTVIDPSAPPLRIPKDAEHDLIFTSATLFDGSLLQVGRVTNNERTLLRPFRRIFFIGMTPVILLGILGGGLFAHRATRPVREVVATARAIIRTGDLSARVPERHTNDELDEMAHLFNGLLDKNQALIDKMRDALDNVAHDLRTPMARVRGVAEMALHAPNDAERMREALADCVEETDRVLTMLKTLMDVAEAEAGMIRLAREKSNVAALLDEVVEVYRYVAEEKGITVTAELDRTCELDLDAPRMRQVFGNLLDNAIKYTEPGESVSIRLFREGQGIAITFRDTGVGIPSAEQDRIWDRLFRGDKSRSQRGLGLGLSLVKAIVEAHGGRVTVSSEVGRGSAFTVSLPSETKRS